MEPNARVELVRRLQAARNARDIEATKAIVAPEMTIHYHMGLPAFNGTWVGVRPEPGSAVAFGAMFWGIFADGTAHLRELDARAVGDHLVLVESEIDFTLDGAEYTLPATQIFRIEGERVVELVDVPDPRDSHPTLVEAAERAYSTARQAFLDAAAEQPSAQAGGPPASD